MPPLVLLVDAAVAVAGLGGHWTLRTSVQARTAAVTVGELIVDSGSTKVGATMRDKVVVRLPAGRSELSASSVARLVHRRIPGAIVELPDGAATIVFEIPPPATAKGPLSSGDCFRAQHGLSAGTQLRATDLHAVPCEQGTRAAALRFDPEAGSFRAAAEIAQGAYLGSVPHVRTIAVGSGDVLTLRARQGPVVIERRVVALQPGRAGRRVFVQTEDGSIVSAPLAGGPGEAR